MRVLLDNNVNHRFAGLLYGHEIIHAREMGWADLVNGELMKAAEANSFTAIVTCDKNLQYQQNLTERKTSIILLNSHFIKWSFIAPLAPQVNAALDTLQEGSFIIISPQ